MLCHACLSKATPAGHAAPTTQKQPAPRRQIQTKAIHPSQPNKNRFNSRTACSSENICRFPALLCCCPDVLILSFWCPVLKNGSSIDLVSYWTLPLSLLIWFSSDLWPADVLISCPTDLVMCWSTVRTVRHPDSHYLSFIKPITKNEDFAQYCQKNGGQNNVCVCVSFLLVVKWWRKQWGGRVYIGGVVVGRKVGLCGFETMWWWAGVVH